MSLRSVLKLARALRFPLVVSQGQLDEMLDDRYRCISIFNSRAECHFHDGALAFGSDAIRGVLMRMSDGYDVVAVTNTNPASSTPSMIRVVADSLNTVEPL